MPSGGNPTRERVRARHDMLRSEVAIVSEAPLEGDSYEIVHMISSEQSAIVIIMKFSASVLYYISPTFPVISYFVTFRA